jgi:hypothetical protein
MHRILSPGVTGCATSQLIAAWPANTVVSFARLQSNGLLLHSHVTPMMQMLAGLECIVRGAAGESFSWHAATTATAKHSTASNLFSE